MIALREFIDRVIVKSSEVIHDCAVSYCSSDDIAENFDFEEFKSEVALKLGELASTAMQ